MSKFDNVMRKNPPHVFVRCDGDKFNYGVVGQMPVAQLIGYITRVQAELAFRNPDPCTENLCVIAYDPQTKKMSWFVDGGIPVDALVGTLELVKCMLVDSQVAAIMQKHNSTGLIALDGKPLT